MRLRMLALRRNKTKFLVAGIIISIYFLVCGFHESAPLTSAKKEVVLTLSINSLHENTKYSFNPEKHGPLNVTVSNGTVPKSHDSDKSKAVLDNQSPEYSPPIIPVYIVEEHHEVIPFWFKAALEGDIPTRGNVLVHIDGHPDDVIPNFEQGLHTLKQSDTPRHFKQLMQSNDRFIMASAFAGFISRIILIYPSWNKQNKRNSVTMIGFGYALGRTFEDELPLCYCEEYLSEPDKLKCFQIDSFDLSSHHTTIQRNGCQVKQIVMFEDIVDYKAEELSQSKDWIPSTDNVFFDIDEDYYGCQDAFESLLDVKITAKYVADVLEPAIQSLFCPQDAKSEQAFDKIFYNMLQRLSYKPIYNKSKQIKTKYIIRDTLQAIRKGNLTGELCNEKTVHSDVKNLILEFSILNNEQLRVLANLGICLINTRKLEGFYRMDGMKLCDGDSRLGNKSTMFFHTPTLEEINKRTIQLENILRKLPEPKVVTLCRSSRDGYVPPQFVSKIETDIIQTLGKVFPNITDSSLHYDPQLLGGKNGWYKRHNDRPW